MAKTLSATAEIVHNVDENGTLIEDLALLKINDTHGQIKYKENGTVINGAVITFNNKSDIYAVLSKDKVIGKSDVVPATIEGAITGVDGQWCMQDFPTGELTEYTEGVAYRFGDVLLARTGQKHHRYISPGSIHRVEAKVWNPLETVTVDQYAHIGLETEEWTTTNVVKMLDYDNIIDKDGNPDKTFITFYSTTSSHGLITRKDTFFTQYPAVSNDWSYITGSGELYYIAYRVNGGNLVNERICSVLRGLRQYGGATFVPSTELFWPFLVCSNSYINSWGEVYPVATFGQRIGSISSKISNKYILYSYIIEDYTEQSWVFNKRIIGIIDIETGTRTEHEVNDTLLGQYKNTFDKTLPSAIGFHNGNIK